MATKTVRVLKAFNGTNKEQTEGGENTRYFTPANQDTAEDFLSGKEFDYRVEAGFLSVEEEKAPVPLEFKTPDERAAETPSAEAATTRRRKPAAAQE